MHAFFLSFMCVCVFVCGVVCVCVFYLFITLIYRQWSHYWWLYLLVYLFIYLSHWYIDNNSLLVTSFILLFVCLLSHIENKVITGDRLFFLSSSFFLLSFFSFLSFFLLFIDPSIHFLTDYCIHVFIYCQYISVLICFWPTLNSLWTKHVETFFKISSLAFYRRKKLIQVCKRHEGVNDDRSFIFCMNHPFKNKKCNTSPSRKCSDSKAGVTWSYFHHQSHRHSIKTDEGCTSSSQK